MIEKLNNSLVKGFLKVKGQMIVNENEEEIILTGWGLGNWLLPEGYMWKSTNNSFDRPRRIENIISELTGDEYQSKIFWVKWRKNYITEEDIKAMANQGYNSVRIPFNWRILMENSPEIVFKKDGFKLLDQFLDWCEKHKIYVFLDLHGAPGGQTGANIDDSFDNIPRLFIDEDSWVKAIALWREIAKRYAHRWIVGGYDLLNEPIRPKNEFGDFDYLLPKLSQFYEEAINAIRVFDKKHLITIEGHHWSTSTKLFTKKFDDNMVIHFHRYACIPDLSAYTEWLDLSKSLNLPLWLGETGENLEEWFTALYPLAASLGIGYNVWPWKKMECTNSPYSVKKPNGWDKIIAFTTGGPKPSYQEAIKIFNELLENIKLKNCVYNPKVTSSVLRLPGCIVRATDFDELPGKNISYSGNNITDAKFNYRINTNMKIVEDETFSNQKRFFFDCLWDRFLLSLSENEFAVYTINQITNTTKMMFSYLAKESCTLSVYQDDTHLTDLNIQANENKTQSKLIKLQPAKEAKIKFFVIVGNILLEKIHFI